MNNEQLENLWVTSKEQFKIQQHRNEWEWLIKTVFIEAKKHNVLEIGAYDGGTSFYLSNFAKNMITIDNNVPCRFNQNKLKDNCNYLYVGGDSHHPDNTSLFKNYDWDFAFIDGDHSYEGVKADFYNLLPHLKKNTPVAFHDIVISNFHHQHGCYVGEFWEELKSEFKCSKMVEFKTNEDWGGIGILWI